MHPAAAGPSATRGRETLAFALDGALIFASQAAVFLYTLANGSDGVAAIEAIVSTFLFTVLVVPLLALFFITWLGTTPGRAVLGLSVRPTRTFSRATSVALIRLRLVARLIDAGMACVIFAAIFIVMAIIVDDVSAAWWKTTLLCFFLLPAIETASIHSYGVTPGKRRLGLRVVDAVHPDKPLPLFRSVARAYVVWLSFALWWVLPIFVWGWAFADQHHRGLHELLAGTKVIQTRAQTSG